MKKSSPVYGGTSVKSMNFEVDSLIEKSMFFEECEIADRRRLLSASHIDTAICNLR